MGKIIDIKGLLGGKYAERKKQRKIDKIWSDLESMSEKEFSEKYNVVSAGPMMNEITSDDETLEEDFEINEEFSQLTDEDLK